MELSLIIAALLGAAVGGIVVWGLSRSRSALERSALETDLARSEERLTLQAARLEELEALEDSYQLLRTDVVRMETQLAEERRAAEEKLAMLQNVRETFQDSFKALSSDALKTNNQSFLELANASLGKFQEGARNDLEKRGKAIDDLVKPLRESLEKVDSKIDVLEKTRVAAFSGLAEQLKLLSESQLSLRNETSNLVKALRAPHARGRWGEIQLRRVVEMAGMVEYCDFLEQASIETPDGRLRPDLVIKLPNNRSIVVDSKVPLDAFLDAQDAATDELRIECLRNHARQVKTHLSQLSTKAYWDQYQPGPDFVVLFLPGETIYSAALEHDPALIEYGVERKVLMSTPTSLIGLLRVVAYGWRQEQLEQNAKQISQLGADLYDRIRTMASHFGEMRKSIEKTVDTYNSAMGSLERRVLVSARRFKDLAASTGAEITAIDPLDKMPRTIEIELVEPAPVTPLPAEAVALVPERETEDRS